MISFSQIILFSSASLILIFTPGPDVIYVMTRGIGQGRKAAIAAAFGFGLGNIVHILFAVAGISALLTSSAFAFQTVKLAGAAYLIYLGIKMFKTTGNFTSDKTDKFLSEKKIFWQSIIANLLNPKVAVFFLAFFPQFIDQQNGNPQIQMLLLGLTFVLLSLLGFCLVAVGSGKIGYWLNSKPALQKRIGKISGSILIGLGLKIAWPDFK